MNYIFINMYEIEIHTRINNVETSIEDLFRNKNIGVDNGIVEKIINANNSTHLLCKCGNPKRITKRGRLSLYCGDKKCWRSYGIPRPEHSIQMKEITKNGKNSGCFVKGIKNNYVNTPDWKRTVLKNWGVVIDGMSDDEICKRYSLEVSERKKNINHKKQVIKTLYYKHNDKYSLDDYFNILKLDEYDVETIIKISKMLNAISTLESDTSKRVAKRFKRTKLCDFSYNIRGLESVTTKSSYETNFINFFENNKIWWDYESVLIKTDSSFYKPDFVFYYKDKRYILEVKGMLFDEQEYFNNKMIFCYRYCIENNYILLFTYMGKKSNMPANMDDLIKEELSFNDKN